MSDETLAAETATTPDEATSNVIETRTTEVYPPLEPLPEEVHGTMHVSSDISEPEGVTISRGVSPSFQDNSVPDNDWDWSQLARPPFILSFVDNDHPSGGFVIGWDTCGSCNLHIRTCKCKDGPSQPSYVKRWRSKDDTKHDKPQPISTATRKAIVVADPDAVAAAVAEVTADEPVGRKRRADAGVKRGPRKDPNATAESVLEAAGNLSAAMSKE